MKKAIATAAILLFSGCRTSNINTVAINSSVTEGMLRELRKMPAEIQAKAITAIAANSGRTITVTNLVYDSNFSTNNKSVPFDIGREAAVSGLPGTGGELVPVGAGALQNLLENSKSPTAVEAPVETTVE